VGDRHHGHGEGLPPAPGGPRRRLLRAPGRVGLHADVVVDLVTTVRPGEPGYPLNAARDGFQDQARWAFSDLVDEVERENESVGRSEDDEVYDPTSDDPTERDGAAELGRLVGEAFDDPALQKVLGEAAGGIMDFYAERMKRGRTDEPVASLAPRGRPVRWTRSRAGARCCRRASARWAAARPSKGTSRRRRRSPSSASSSR
jgi:hypothetical protein